MCIDIMPIYLVINNANRIYYKILLIVIFLGIQNDQITIEKGVWTELMITHQNNGSEVVENNVSLNGRCIQSTINTDNMRILCKDSNASSSEALCYEYQILFRAEKNIEIGLCIYTLRNSGIPKPTNYPQYRIIVIGML